MCFHEQILTMALQPVPDESLHALAVESSLQIGAGGRPVANVSKALVLVLAVVGVGHALKALVAVAAEGALQVGAVGSSRECFF